MSEVVTFFMWQGTPHTEKFLKEIQGNGITVLKSATDEQIGAEYVERLLATAHDEIESYIRRLQEQGH